MLYACDELLKACQKGNIDDVRELLTREKLRANINYRDKDGYSPLILSSYYGHLDIVKYLLTY